MISKTQPKTVFINKANNQSLNVTLPRFDKYSVWMSPVGLLLLLFVPPRPLSLGAPI